MSFPQGSSKPESFYVPKPIGLRQRIGRSSVSPRAYLTFSLSAMVTRTKRGNRASPRHWFKRLCSRDYASQRAFEKREQLLARPKKSTQKPGEISWTR